MEDSNKLARQESDQSLNWLRELVSISGKSPLVQVVQLVQVGSTFFNSCISQIDSAVPQGKKPLVFPKRTSFP
jgi:hypothetical protein